VRIWDKAYLGQEEKPVWLEEAPTAPKSIGDEEVRSIALAVLAAWHRTDACSAGGGADGRKGYR
jgi:hypothetical protein